MEKIGLTKETIDVLKIMLQGLTKLRFLKLEFQKNKLDTEDLSHITDLLNVLNRNVSL